MKSFLIEDKEITVEIVHSSSRNCFHRQIYLISSNQILTEENIEQLRMQHAFMWGQETGVCNLSEVNEEDGRFFYTAKSVCDSGD